MSRLRVQHKPPLFKQIPMPIVELSTPYNVLNNQDAVDFLRALWDVFVEPALLDNVIMINGVESSYLQVIALLENPLSNR